MPVTARRYLAKLGNCMDIVCYPSKTFAKEVERLCKLRQPFVVRVPTDDPRQEILLERLPTLLADDGAQERHAPGVLRRTMRILGFYLAAASALNEGYEMSYEHAGDLLITFAPFPIDGVTYFTTDRLESALSAFKAEAADGKSHALVWLGWMHETGKGTPADAAAAERCYGLAAKAGSMTGVHFLAHLLARTGRQSEAIAHWKEAASQKFAPAIYRLGRLYEAGDGVPKDEARAVAMFREAASLGNLWARRRLALRMIRGKEGIARVGYGFKLFARYCRAHFLIGYLDMHHPARLS